MVLSLNYLLMNYVLLMSRDSYMYNCICIVFSRSHLNFDVKEVYYDHVIPSYHMKFSDYFIPTILIEIILENSRRRDNNEFQNSVNN